MIFNRSQGVVNNVFCTAYVYLNSYGIIKVMGNVVDILMIALAAVTAASLQLGTGTLLLLYHETLGRKIPKRTKKITWGYILGAFLFAMLELATAALVILVSAGGALSNEALIIVSGLAVLMAILVLLCYYRRGKNAMLWVPNFVAKYLKKRANKADTVAEGIALGMTTELGELPFMLVLIVIAANSLINLPRAEIILAIAGYALIIVMPLLITKVLIKNGENLVNIQKARVKNKTFLKIFTSVCYVAMAAFLIAFKIMGR